MAQEEIDLRFVYGKIRNMFSSIWNAIAYCFYIGFKRKILLILFSIAGAGIGVGLFYTMRPVYVSTMVLTSNSLANDFCSDIINNLNLIIRDNTPEFLAKELNIQPGSARAIKEFEFDNYDENLKKIYKGKDTVVLGRPFKIKAYVYNNTVFDTLQAALTNYMESNEYALIRKNIKIENTKLMREALQKQIAQLDSLKLKVSADVMPRGTASGFVFGEPIDPVNIFKQEITLYQNDLALRRELLLSDNIQVIQGFTPRLKPDAPRLKSNIILYGLVGLFIGFLFSLYLEAKNRNREHN